MKHLGPASESDLPSGLADALHADPDDVFYCMTCDGLRVREGHEHPAPNHGGECPHCGRVMSKRERAEQGACNECYTPNPASDW